MSNASHSSSDSDFIIENKSFDNYFYEDKKFLHILLDYHSDYIYFKNKDLKFIKINKKTAEAFGLANPDDAIGKTDYDFFPNSADQIQKNEQKIMTTGIPQINEPEELVFADGKTHWVSTSKVPFYDEQQNLAGIVGISRDITKTKVLEDVLEERKTVLELIFDSSPNCMYIKDKYGRYIIANKTIADLYQTHPEEMIGKTDEDFADQAVLKPAEASFFQDIDKKVIESQEKQIVPSEPFTWNDGSIHYFRTTKIPVTFKDEYCVLGISVDITPVKQAEREKNEHALKFKSLFETIKSGVAVYEAVDNGDDFIFKDFNSSAEEIENIKRDEVIGRRVTEVFPGVRELGLFKVFQRVWKTGESEFIPARVYKDEHDSKSWRENRVYKLPTGEIVAVYDDVTDKKNKELLLKQSEKKYRTLFERMEQGAIYQNFDGTLIDANNKALELFGITREEFLGRTSESPEWDVIDEQGEKISGKDHPSYRALRTGKPVCNETIGVYNQKRNEYVWVIVNAFPQFKEGRSKPYQVFMTMHDVTKQRKTEQNLRESEKKLRLKLDSVLSPDVKLKKEDFANIINSDQLQSLMDDFYELTHIGIGILDMDGNILVATGWQDICTQFHRVHPETKKNCIESDTYLSQHVEPGKYVKYKCKNNMWDMATPIILGGKRMGTVFLGQFFLEHEEVDYSFFEQQADRYGFDKEKYLKALDQVPRWDEKTVSTVMNFYAKFSEMISKLSYSNLKLARLVEKQKRSEQQLSNAHQQLKLLNKNLEHIVSIRTKELSKVIKLKDDFINQLGHDLKTPLGPLVSLLPVIENHVTDPKDKEMLMVIQRNVFYMKNLVKKTLDLARLNSPNTSFDFEQISLHDLVEQMTEKNASFFNENNVTFLNSVPKDIIVYADEMQLFEVLDNIVNNSVKYKKDDMVTIIFAAEKHDNKITISINDDGIGMNQKQIEHVFNEFYKADESRHDFDSSGLGLPICKRIIEKHGGRIWVESEGTGKGSTFYFTLPTHHR